MHNTRSNILSNHKSMRIFLALAVTSLFFQINVFANSEASKRPTQAEEFGIKNLKGQGGFCGLCLLCAKKIKADQIQALQVDTTELCADRASIDTLCTDSVVVQDARIDRLTNRVLCGSQITANNICANSVATDNLCVPTLRMDRLCADQSISTSNFCAEQAQIDDLWTNLITATHVCVAGAVEHCTPYKAHLSLTATTLYALGDDIDWDKIVDDPNGNVILGPTRYVVPKTGYYVMTLGVGILSLEGNGNSVIAGTPVTRPEIVVNGTRRLKAFESFLSFGTDFQESIVSGLLPLNEGDEVTCRYRIFYIDPNTGVSPFDGNVVLEAVGTQGQVDTETFFTIHYLSSTCDTINCPPCTVECLPCPTTTCPPCTETCPSINIPCPTCEDCEIICPCSCPCTV